MENLIGLQMANMLQVNRIKGAGVGVKTKMSIMVRLGYVLACHLEIHLIYMFPV